MAHFSRKRKKKKFTLGTPKDLAILLWVAEQKGFLSDRDVPVDIVFVPYSRKAVEMLIDGELDSAIAVETNVCYLGYTKSKIPIKCLFSLEKRTADSILFNEADAQPEDLIGKTIGFMPRTTSHTFLIQFMSKYGLGKADIKLKPLTPQAMPPAFMRGEVDAISLWHPHASNTMLAMHELGKPYTHFKNFGFHTSEVVFATNKTFMVKNRAMIEGLIKALKDAENFLKNDKEIAYKILAQRMNVSGPDYKEVLDTFQPTLNAIGRDYIKNIELLSEWIRQNDTEFIGKDPPNYWDCIDNEIFLDVFTEKE